MAINKTFTTDALANTSTPTEGLFQRLISILTNDAQLNAIVPASQIFVGPVDIVEETQAGLQLPQINIHMVSEVSRTVPSATRDTMFQIDIWSRNSQLEVESIYERIISLLTYNSGDTGVTHLFWERLSGSIDMYEADRRIFHRAMTFVAWIQKPL